MRGQCKTPGCLGLNHARGLCRPCYRRAGRRGELLPLPRPPTAERFGAHVSPEPNSGCWVWVGEIATDTGYGRMSVEGESVFAHRLSWQLHRGMIPDGLFVCHRCDHPWCVNPDHLFLGTHQDNMRDMVAKGRANLDPKVIGEGHPRARLNIGVVRRIRAMHARGSGTREIADAVGVRRDSVYDVVHGRCWGHIQ